MYPMVSGTGSQNRGRTPDQRQAGSGDDERGNGSSYGSNSTPSSPSMAEASPGMSLAGGPGAIASMMGGAGGGMSGMDQSSMAANGAQNPDEQLMLIRDEFQGMVEQLEQMAQMYPMAGQFLGQAQQAVLQALLQVGQALQPNPTSPPISI